MRAKVKTDFRDLAAGVIRKGGEEFELTDERFAEIDAKLPGFIEREEQPKKAATRRRTATKKAE